jgi:hypothetical protein
MHRGSPPGNVELAQIFAMTPLARIKKPTHSRILVANHPTCVSLRR